MKVLIIAAGTIHKNSGYRHRVFKMFSELQNQGEKITLVWLSTYPNYYKEICYVVKQSNYQIKVIPSLPFFKNLYVGHISRFINSCFIRIFSALGKYDIVQAEGTLCGALCKKTNKKIIIDYHGDAYSEKKMVVSERWKHSLAWHDEINAIKKANGAIIVSDAMRDILHQLSPSKNIPVSKVPCGVEIDRFISQIENRERNRKKLGIEDKFVLCYMGGLNKWQCVEETTKIFLKIKANKPEVFFLIITQDDTSHLKELLHKGSSAEDYCIKSLFSEEIPLYLPVADLCFLLREDNPVNKVASPTKFGEYLAAGVPVFATHYSGDAAKVIMDNGVGFLLDDIDPDKVEIEKIIDYIEQVKQQRSMYSEKCVSTATNSHNWDLSKTALKELYVNLADKRT